jgi:hypothetical protein
LEAANRAQADDAADGSGSDPESSEGDGGDGGDADGVEMAPRALRMPTRLRKMVRAAREGRLTGRGDVQRDDYLEEEGHHVPVAQDEMVSAWLSAGHKRRDGGQS